MPGLFPTRACSSLQLARMMLADPVQTYDPFTSAYQAVLVVGLDRVKLGLLNDSQLKQFEAFRRSKLDRKTVGKVRECLTARHLLRRCMSV